MHLICYFVFPNALLNYCCLLFAKIKRTDKYLNIDFNQKMALSFSSNRLKTIQCSVSIAMLALLQQ